MIERLWHSVKHEEVFLRAYENASQALLASATGISPTITGNGPIRHWADGHPMSYTMTMQPEFTS